MVGCRKEAALFPPKGGPRIRFLAMGRRQSVSAQYPSSPGRERRPFPPPGTGRYPGHSCFAAVPQGAARWFTKSIGRDTPIRGGVSGVKGLAATIAGRSSSFAAAVNSSRFRRRGVAFLSEIYPCSFRFLLEKGPIRHILYRQRILSEADGRLLWIKRESDPSYMENGASRSSASRGGRPARPEGLGRDSRSNRRN